MARNQPPETSDDGFGIGRGPRDRMSHSHPKPLSPAELAHDVHDPSVDKRGDEHDRMVNRHRQVERGGSYPQNKR
jgi:hypothetical protein